MSNDSAQPMQMPTPDPALKRLEKLVGTWDITGHTLDSEDDNISGRPTFEWVEGRGGDWNSFVFFSDPDGNGWVLQERPARD